MSYLGELNMFRLTAKPMLNTTLPSIVSTVGLDTPIYQLVFYNVLIRQWSSRGIFLWEIPKQLE